MSENEIKTKLKSIPKTREARMASILATVRSQPEGLNLQYVISMFAVNFGLTRPKIVEYFRQLERAQFIRIGRVKVYPRN